MAQYRELVEKLKSPEYHISKIDADLLHASMGLNTEQAELQDAIKRVVYYGTDIDYVNVKEELGDILFYLMLACVSVDVTLEELIETNTGKLNARYKEGFSKEAAVNRDLETERQVLSGDVQ